MISSLKYCPSPWSLKNCLFLVLYVFSTVLNGRRPACGHNPTTSLLISMLSASVSVSVIGRTLMFHLLYMLYLRAVSAKLILIWICRRSVVVNRSNCFHISHRINLCEMNFVWGYFYFRWSAVGGNQLTWHQARNPVPCITCPKLRETWFDISPHIINVSCCLSCCELIISWLSYAANTTTVALFRLYLSGQLTALNKFCSPKYFYIFLYVFL